MEPRKLITIINGVETTIATEAGERWELPASLSLAGLYATQLDKNGSVNAIIINDEPPVEPPVVSDLPYLPGGAAVMGVAWANLTLGKHDSDVIYGFRAPVSGEVVSYTFNLQKSKKTGYSAGNGGEYVVQLVKGIRNVARRPSFDPADVVAEGTIKHTNGDIYSEKSIDERLFNIKTGRVEKGEMYYLWFKNSLSTEAERRANWSSVNTANNAGKYVNPIQPGFDDADLFTLTYFRGSGSFIEKHERTPIFSIRMKNSGVRFGQGHFTQRTVSGNHRIQGNVAARQLYTHVIEDKSYSHLMLNLIRVNSPGNLYVEIAEIDGNKSATVSVPANQIKTERGWWISIRLDDPFLFKKDKQYLITLSARGSNGGYYSISDVQKGYRQFFESDRPDLMNVRFGKNYAQLRNSSGVWLDGWEVSGNVRQDSDLPLYFDNRPR